MAKYKATAPDKKVKTSYPSEYGSHVSMIDEDYVEFNSADNSQVICKDDRGSYMTTKKVLDTGLCDSNRAVNVELRDERLKIALESLN